MIGRLSCDHVDALSCIKEWCRLTTATLKTQLAANGLCVLASGVSSWVPVMECDQEKVSNTSSTQDTKQQNERCRPKLCLCARKPCSRQPDGPYAYFVCFCGFVCMILSFGCSFGYGILFPLLLDEFREGKGKTGELIDTIFIWFSPLSQYILTKCWCLTKPPGVERKLEAEWFMLLV